MGTAYIDTTVTAEPNGVFMFQIECTAEIEYEVDGGELADWRIRDFRFDSEKSAWDDTAGQWVRRKIGEAWCPDSLRPALLEFANKDMIEEQLVEQLLSSGEMYFANAGRRADYHSAVL